MAGAPRAFGDPPADALHGGQGRGVKVVGHTNLGLGELAPQGLNADVSVLGDYAYVGFGTNGGFAAQWNKAPQCKAATAELNPGTVKVVSLVDPTRPTVVAEIPIANRSTMARAVAAARVDTPAFRGDLLAVGREACAFGTASVPGLDLYDVTNPTTPVPLAHIDRSGASRDVALIQRADGKVLALEAHQTRGILVTDVTNPRLPAEVASLSRNHFFTDQDQGCRPFSFAQGASFNTAGTTAYAAYGDEGLLELTANLDAVNRADRLAVTGKATYPLSQEGNSFRFEPNASETNAIATDEDLNPAKTTLTVNGGPASLYTEPGGTVPGVFRGCEAIWGGPLYERATPSITADLVYAGTGCSDLDYLDKGAAGKIAVVDRGGTASVSITAAGQPCSFDDKARIAQAAGAAAIVIANLATDHHAGGPARLFSPDAVRPADAGVSIPVAMITKEARDAIVPLLAFGPVNATLADSADTWGALRVFDLAGANPAQVATFNSPNSSRLTPGDGLYHAVQGIWEGNQALVAWMSDGLRVVDLSDPSSPKGRAFYVPPAASDPTGNYPTVPLVVSVAKFGSRVVITDVNGGLYVLDVILSESQCVSFANYGFSNRGECHGWWRAQGTR